MVLLGVVDAEPEAGFWAQPVDCERLAAELQLPITDLVDALRGKLTPWLADDLDILLHDDAHEHAADHSPAQTLASAVLAHYRSDMAAEQTTTRLVRALEYAPEDYQVELGTRLARLPSSPRCRPRGREACSGHWTRPGRSRPRCCGCSPSFPGRCCRWCRGATTPPVPPTCCCAGEDRDETVRAAVSVVARLARAAFGPDLEAAEVLQRLGMVDDAGLARLARLWVDLALASSDGAPSTLGWCPTSPPGAVRGRARPRLARPAPPGSSPC